MNNRQMLNRNWKEKIEEQVEAPEQKEEVQEEQQ